MRCDQKTRLEEFVLYPKPLFEGHGWQDPDYLPLFGVFDHIGSHVGSALDCRGVEVKTAGIWKIYVSIVDASQPPPHEAYVGDGVLQPPLRIDRAAFDAAGDLLAKKRYVAGIVAEFVQGLGSRWPIDPTALVELLRECEQSGEVLEFHTPVAMVRNAAGTRGARWFVRITFFETVIGIEIDDDGISRRLDLIRWPGASFTMVCFFTSSIRWTGDASLVVRSKPDTDRPLSVSRLGVILEDAPGVRFARVPARRGENLTDYQKSEFRFEWRIATRELGT
jgi:hypothetical protein